MPCWLFNLDAQQLTLELQTKLTKALLKSKTNMNASKQKTLDLLINESVQRILLDIHDGFEREFCGLCLCTLIYEHLLKKDSLNSLQMTLWTNLTVEKVKLAFNNEKIDEFCFYAELDYRLEGPHEPSIEELASKGMSTLQRLGNLEQFKIETSTLIDKFISTVPKNQYVVLIGNSPAYLYSLLAEQDYRVIILPLSGIKRCTLPKDEQGWGILINYVEQVIKAQAPAHQNPSALNSFCLVDYAATGAGLWAAHLIFSRYLAYANPGVAPIRLNLVVIPSTLPQSYRTIIEVLHDLDPIILLTPQAEEESITTQILDSKFLSKQGLKLCKAINLEHIIQGAIKKIPIDHNGFIALQLLMRAIMQGVSIEFASRSRERVLQTCLSTSRALQTIDFTPTEQRGICGLGDAPNGFFAKAKELKGTMDAASSNSNNVKTEYGCS